MRTKPLILTFILGLLLSAAPSLAQKGMLRGTVLDSDRNPIQGVQVTITSEELTSYRDTLTTDKRGNFRVRFQSNQAQYQFLLLFEKPGFQSFTVPMSPSMTQPMKEEWTMEVGTTVVAESHGDLSSIVTGSTNAAIEAFNQGLSAQRERDLGEARTQFEAALAVDPELAPAHTALGEVLLDLEEYASALESADQALALEGSAVAAFRVKYQALRALGRAEEADAVGLELEAAEGAVASARRIYNEAGEAFQADDRATALEKFREAAELDSSLTEAHHAIATLELALGHFDLAAESAEKALALGSEDISTLRVLYDAYDALGRMDELSEIAPRLAAVDPDYGGGKLLEQAAAAWNSGQAERAADLSRLALSMDPGQAKAHYFLGLYHLSKGENSEGKAALEKFVQLAPEDSDAATAREMISYVE